MQDQPQTSAEADGRAGTCGNGTWAEHQPPAPAAQGLHTHGKVVERDGLGRSIRMTGTNADITERKRFELALAAAREHAEAANRHKSEFLSSISHELRTPMNAILGFGQLLEYDDALSVEQLDNVHEILKAGKHLLDLINEVLDLAKIESGNIMLSLEAVALSPVVEDCLGLISSLADKRVIQISLSGLRGAVVLADRTRLRQILLNLHKAEVRPIKVATLTVRY